MTEPIFRDDLRVVPVRRSGDDRAVAEDAWVVDPECAPAPGRDAPADHARVIGQLIRGRHTAPFEHTLAVYYWEVPAVVWWEATRHRFMSQTVADHSFGLESGRYRVLDGVFYTPPAGRPCWEPPGFQPMRPVLNDGKAEADHARRHAQSAAAAGWREYEAALAAGVAREVARLCLPFSVYYAGRVSGNLATWLHFLSLRTRHPAAAVPSYPQWEIERVAAAVEADLGRTWPAALAAFAANGRRFGP